MPNVTSEEPGAAQTIGSSPPGLVLAPFHGVRYAQDKVGDLAVVTSPPYDVIDPESVLALESSESHNVVRLILPRDEECGAESRYEHAALTLRRWLREGVLRADASPALYVYEQDDGQRVLQRGLVGSVGLRDPADRVVLPHEDVMAGPVADRLELMRAAQANVEPILLMYDGQGGPTAAVLAQLAGTEPQVNAVTADGITHRLWRLDDPALLSVVAADLAGRQALIADGHHRYAAYRALQVERDAVDGAGPWDSGLALLVDLRAHPPAVGAIHRAVAGLSFQRALAGLDERFVVTRTAVPDPVAAAGRLVSGRMLLLGPHGDGAFVEVADQPAVDALVARDHPEQWVGLDTAVLHQVLVEDVWAIAEDQVSYHHDVEGAVRAARRDDGVAVLLAPVAVESVLALAAQGVRMPRKSTSFGPKPRTGLVLRTFDTD